MNFEETFKNWHAPYISRKDLCNLTGNLLSFKTLRNLDSLGKGIPGKFLIGSKTAAYPVQNAIKWFEDRITNLNPQTEKKQKEAQYDDRYTIT